VGADGDPDGAGPVGGMCIPTRRFAVATLRFRRNSRGLFLSRPSRIAWQAPSKADSCACGHAIHSEKRPGRTFGEGQGRWWSSMEPASRWQKCLRGIL
jgi:hypothetical protein